MGIEVCELRRKFQLLKSYGVITSLKVIAEKVGRKENTLWGWADGNATTEANRVPPKNFDAFRIAFIEVLKDHVASERAEALLFAPASHLENDLRRTKGPQTPSLLDLIEAEADTTAIRIIRLADDQKRERGLIETQLDRQPKGPVHHVKQGEWFRLVVERDLTAFNILALQHGGGLWGAVPWSAESGSGYLHLPGFQTDGTPAYMRERSALGENLFVVMATITPAPSWSLDQKTFDDASLCALKMFIYAEEKTRRMLECLKLNIQ
jgi:hypothetical protein